jgi:hypothetical protein
MSNQPIPDGPMIQRRKAPIVPDKDIFAGIDMIAWSAKMKETEDYIASMVKEGEWCIAQKIYKYRDCPEVYEAKCKADPEFGIKDEGDVYSEEQKQVILDWYYQEIEKAKH